MKAKRPDTERIEARPSKYGNRRSESRDGHTFASKRERDRYEELLMLEAANEIRVLELQRRYPLVVNGIKIGTYVADFCYQEGRFSVLVVEDVKGHRTREYLLKRKLMLALYGTEIRET